MREKFLKGVETTDWTLAAKGNTGDAIRMGMALGAAVDLMDDAWWGPTIIPTNEPPYFMLMERTYPGGIIVNSAGERFTNESASYVDAVHAMREKNSEDAVTIPAHFIIDHRFRSKYILGLIPPGWTPKKYLESGYIKKADTLEKLAVQTGIEPSALVSTVKRFNKFARKGRDPDFGRGESVYDRFYGDSRVKPNPCLAPIEKPPFYSVKVYPGDIGTKGGLVTNEHAQVLREDGTIIKGLYAAGNTAASVMGNTYPGPGSTLGPTMTFGYIAARDAAQQKKG
jgi:3-oxosteroid 1-dehydrogenase